MIFEYCPPVQIPDLPTVTLPDGKRFYTLPSGKIIQIQGYESFAIDELLQTIDENEIK